MKLTYQDCVELRDAGFPQKGDGLFVGNVGLIKPEDISPNGVVGIAQEDFCYIPTLSELIAECGEEFNGLIQITLTQWVATGGNHIGFYADDYVERGSTAERAVKNLYIALHKHEAVA